MNDEEKCTVIGCDKESRYVGFTWIPSRKRLPMCQYCTEHYGQFLRALLLGKNHFMSNVRLIKRKLRKWREENNMTELEGSKNNGFLYGMTTRKRLDK